MIIALLLDIKYYTQLLPDNITEGEVCPQALVLVEEMAQRLKHYGGTALLADYGHKDIKYFTLRVSTSEFVTIIICLI